MLSFKKILIALVGVVVVWKGGQALFTKSYDKYDIVGQWIGTTLVYENAENLNEKQRKSFQELQADWKGYQFSFSVNPYNEQMTGLNVEMANGRNILASINDGYTVEGNILSVSATDLRTFHAGMSLFGGEVGSNFETDYEIIELTEDKLLLKNLKGGTLSNPGGGILTGGAAFEIQGMVLEFKKDVEASQKMKEPLDMKPVPLQESANVDLNSYEATVTGVIEANVSESNAFGTLHIVTNDGKKIGIEYSYKNTKKYQDNILIEGFDSLKVGTKIKASGSYPYKDKTHFTAERIDILN